MTSKTPYKDEISSNRSERIAKIRSLYFKNKYEDFAIKLEVSVKYASGLCNKKEVITEKTLEKILKTFPEISRNWLYFGEGEMFYHSAGTISNTATGNTNVGSIIQGRTIETKGNDELVLSQQKTIALLTEQTTKFQEQIDRLLAILERRLE